MRKSIKSLNGITYTLFCIGVFIFLLVDNISKLAVGYMIIMQIYYLFAELFDFHLWEASDCREKELNALMGRKEKQHDKTRNY
ncbi:hypothetical protein [Enterococcus larvae]|uniref:hypothetical protein n=1 Tax=Enterococcus larvae TaxID=2794352 RepID=UPI003F35E6BF